MGLYRRKDSDIWWMSFTFNGRQIRRSTETVDKKLGEKIYAKVLTKVVEGKWFEFNEASQHTFDEMMERFMNEYAPKQEITTQIRYTSALDHLKRYFAGISIAEITPKRISEYIALRRVDTAKASTINKERNMLSKAFNLAWKQWEWCHSNPCNKVPREIENNFVNRWLLADEEERLLQAAEGYLKGQLAEIIVIALNTGMRRGEILNMKWIDVDLLRKVFTVLKTKNKEPKTIPMNETVYRLLIKKNKFRSMSGYVFTTENNTRISPRNMAREFYNALRKAGIQDFRFHDLRHTFASRLVQSGVDLFSVAKLLGHKDIKTTQRYAHHYPESLRRSVQILDRFSKRVESPEQGGSEQIITFLSR